MSFPKVTIIYASTSGNVEAVCQAVADFLIAEGMEVDLHRSEATDFEVIANNQSFIFATSTWEHGELNPFFFKLLKEMQAHDLTGKRAAFIGLGDRRYDPVLFCKGVEFLRQEFAKSGGEEIATVLRINGDPYPFIDTVVAKWSKSLVELLKHG